MRRVISEVDSPKTSSTEAMDSNEGASSQDDIKTVKEMPVLMLENKASNPKVLDDSTNFTNRTNTHIQSKRMFR